ncbi:hypothetical protein B1813_00145 [Saccharomonospora piscinae]|uniref:Uncharacterized protein n=1 Tax=Saccharomonospora piscinae TaxID=687388 RepID=A0A1V9ABR1_SACPI|nr:hypothetical protein [Saccharomonospora piscinae]OQO94569.1 hypothetical protein B1813_00145 [Saccharomonospora piscinae]
MQYLSQGGVSSLETSRAAWELDARVDQAFRRAREARQQMQDAESRLAAKSAPPTDEEIERIRLFVLGHARTPEWERVIELINRGLLSWREVTDGLATGRLDHRVAAAFDSLSKVPPASEAALAEIGVIRTEPADDEPEPPTPGRPVARGPREDDDEESFFDDPLARGR